MLFVRHIISIIIMSLVIIIHRWDKPDSHIVEAMESRMKDLDLASERSIKVKLDIHSLYVCCARPHCMKTSTLSPIQYHFY